jgi:DNA-binding protein H-NS
MPKMTVADQLEKIKVARAKLDREEKKLLLSSHEKALTQIVQIVRTVGLSHEQVLAALGGKVRGKAGGKTRGPGGPRGKVAPKYRNPANSEQTWTGRGRMPLWVADLHAQGALDSALIQKP